MGFKDFFTGDDKEKLDYLEEERKKIWAKIIEIEADVQKKTPDIEKDAKQASKKASEYRNRCKESKDAAFQYLDSIKLSYGELTSLSESIKEINDAILDIKSNGTESLELSKNSCDEIVALENSIRKKIENLEEIFEAHPNLNSEISELENIFTEGEDLQSKINTLYKSSLNKKKEIDQLYYDIIGYKEEGESGEETHVEGMKDELESSFEEIKDNVKKFDKELTLFKEGKEKEVNNSIETWSKNIEGINKKITQLLPNALTAGLSHAYSDKKEAEEVEARKHTKSFHKFINWLVLVSLIPFGVNVILWRQGKSLENLILDMPRLVLAILPLYIPLLWVAYTSNKKSNLSKRLIEEYTHKEVLSKTFEGLSRQINEIDDEEISSELRVKLIYNILNVSSENPGKLITDYNKADHPLIDALDKSVQLATAVDKLSGIPGFSKISKILDNKSKRILEEEAVKAEQGLSSLEDDKEVAKNELAKSN